MLKIVCFLLIDFVNEVVLNENAGYWMIVENLITLIKLELHFREQNS